MMRATVWSEAASGLSTSMLVVGSRYCGGLGTPVGPAASMDEASSACAWMERLTTTSYSFAKRLVSSAVRMEESAVDPACEPKRGCDNPEIGMGPAGVTFNWNEVWPERKRAMPAVEMQVNMEFAFMFMLSMRSATAPPHPTCSALPPLEAIA